MKVISVTVSLVAALSVGCSKDSPTSPTTPARTSPVTETFTSNLTAQGSVWRLVAAQQSGTLTASLSATDQPAALIGFAIGLRNGTGSGCLVTRELTATAGSAPQLAAPVDAGNYCVKIFDAASLPTSMSFTITLTYP